MITIIKRFLAKFIPSLKEDAPPEQPVKDTTIMIFKPMTKHQSKYLSLYIKSINGHYSEKMHRVIRNKVRSLFTEEQFASHGLIYQYRSADNANSVWRSRISSHLKANGYDPNLNVYRRKN